MTKHSKTDTKNNSINSKLNCLWLFDNEKMQHLRISALEHT